MATAMSTVTESLSERQENEMEVLKAVYMDDVKDLRENDAWKVKRAPEVTISLYPQESISTAEAHVTIDLIILCPDDYPNKIPAIKIESHKGLSKKQMATLQEELIVMATSLIGEVMILELCQHTQSFLHNHNKPPPKSFYEEMMSNKKRLEEMQAAEQEKRMEMLRKKEEKELEQIEKEIEKRQIALKEDAKRRRELAKNIGVERMSLSEPNTPSTESVRAMTPIPRDTEQRKSRGVGSPEKVGTPVLQKTVAESASHQKPDQKDKRRRRTSTPVFSNSNKSDEDDCQDHLGTTVLAFDTKTNHTVHRGKCLGHSVRGSAVYAGMDTKSGDLVAISEWIIKWSHANRKLKLDEQEINDNDGSKYLKQVISIEQEMFSLLNLSHKNVVKYSAIKYTKEPSNITVYIMSDFIGGGSLGHYLKKQEPVLLESLRSFTCDIVDGLAYLHNKAVTHKDLRASSLLLDNHGRVRLADYSLSKRLTELVREADEERAGVRFDDNTTPSIGARGSKKADIYRLGITLLSLAEGHLITDVVPEIPTHFPQDFQDFLTKCLIRDEQHRWSVHQLVDHSFLKTPIYANAAPKHSIHVDNKKETSPVEDDDLYTGIPFIPPVDSGSRLQNEFEIQKWLGKGGFGDVIKVKNKLDGRYYAIKRIPLNPSRKQFNKKITREVKLLSRLNHESVVRYYNSWIETSNEPVPSDTSSITVTSGSPQKSSLMTECTSTDTKLLGLQKRAQNSLGLFDNVDSFTPGHANDTVDWSMAQDEDNDGDSSSSNDEDVDYVFGASFRPQCDSDDDGIVFEETSKLDDWSIVNDVNIDADENKANTTGAETETDERPTTPYRLQFLYIQMEFCEKSTLRNLIDAGLHTDTDRVWRLFREIIEGLSHIHDQGMIHRDLKPVNIFLDSNDNVKIGDFGLATTDIISKHQTSFIDLSLNPSMTIDSKHSSSRSDSSLGDGVLTGKVGTALYVSPEIMSSNRRAQYNQKVDIYSLGIIFFEMCYKPLNTGMERVQIIGNLRLPSVTFPEDFDELEMPGQAGILRWLLNHDASKRPTANELLQSELMPPPQFEEAELTEVLRSTLMNKDRRAFKHMVHAIFSQPTTPAIDFAYDSDIYKAKTVAGFSKRLLLAQQHAAHLLEKIYKKHGAIKVSTPLLMPKSAMYDSFESYACFMDHSGGIVALPHDLRSTFARYVARNSITSLKRFTLEKVYRENRLYGLHPKEITASAFDIVFNLPSHQIPEAEVIHVVHEIITELPPMLTRSYYLMLNHTTLLKAVLIHSGVPEELHQAVYTILGDSKGDRQRKLQIQTKLCSLSLSDQTIASLYNFLELEGPFGKIASALRSITKTKGQASALAKKGINEMLELIANTEAMGCKFHAVLSLGLVYNISQFSGVVFQIVAEHKKKKAGLDVLAAGGRYDGMIDIYRRLNSPAIAQYGVGVSVAFDKVVSAALECESLDLPKTYDVAVCSLGQKASVKDKLAIAKDLWAVGLSVEVLHDSSTGLEEIQDYCKEQHIPHLVILKEIASGFVRVRSTEKERTIEKKVNVAEIAEFMSQKYLENSDYLSGPNPKGPSGSNMNLHESSSNTGVGSQSCSSSSSLPSYNLTFILQDSGKLAKNQKRHYESQIYSLISNALRHFSKTCKVEVLAVDLPSNVVRCVASFLDLEKDEAAFENSISLIVEKHVRYKKYLTKIFDHIHGLQYDSKNDQISPVILLYSYKDDSYKILL